MREYVLSAAQFRELAAGYGDRATVEVLLDGQLARRRLLLLGIHEEIRRHGGPDARQFEAALALLRAAERRSPAAARTALAHAQVGVWAARLLRRTAGEPAGGAGLSSEIGYFCALASASAASAGMPFSTVVPAGGDEVILPTLGVARHLGAGPVQIRGDGRRIVLTAAGAAVEVAAPFRRRGRRWRPRRTISLPAADGGLDLAIEDIDPYRDCFGRRPAPRLVPTEVEDLRRVWRRAWRLLVRGHPRHAATIRAVLRSLVPLVAAGRAERFSATSQDSFGAIGLSPVDDPESLAELLLHELQHLKLCALLDLVELYHDGGDIRYYAPWRPEPRPVGALLQGVYAHLGVTDYWRIRRSRVAGGEVPDSQLEFAYWRHQTWLALSQLHRSEALTEHGRTFVRSMAATLRKWSTEPVPAAAEAAARRRATAHLSTWRRANPVAAGLLPPLPPAGGPGQV